jgi:hypothetical protein
MIVQHDNTPSPEGVREMCIRRAWDDEVDDDSRLLLEMAAVTIREQHGRLMRTAKLLEASECEASLLRRVVRESRRGGES